MRRFIMILAAVIAVTLNAAAQSAVQRFTSAMAGKCVTFQYSFSVNAKVAVKGSGEVKVQDNAFVTSYGNVEIYCDGETRWTVDSESHEVIIEQVDGGTEVAASVDPALIVSEMDKHFRIVSSSRVLEGGRSLEKVSFSPLDGTLGMAAMTVWFSTASSPAVVKASIKMKEGAVTDFSIPSMSFSQKLPLSAFRFDMKKTDSSWVVTDLR